MRLPEMSNGAWIFASAVAVAIIAPGVYAASSSIVSIGNPNNNATALVIGGTHQLQTAITVPANVVHAAGSAGNSSCHTVYTPPAGKAIVVTQITYQAGSGTPGTENFGGFFDLGCNTGYDFVDTVQAYETETRTFPTGLPLTGVAINSTGGWITVFLTGYLIPATLLPAAAPQAAVPVKGMPRG
jgi:hypothetical protein